MNNRNKLCRGNLSWMAHASAATSWVAIGKTEDGTLLYRNTETGQVITSAGMGGHADKGFGSYFSNAVGTGDTSAIRYKTSGASKPKKPSDPDTEPVNDTEWEIFSVAKNGQPLARNKNTGQVVYANSIENGSSSKLYSKPIGPGNPFSDNASAAPAKGHVETPKTDYDVRNTMSRQRTVQPSSKNDKASKSKNPNWKPYQTETTYKSTPDGKIMQITTTKNRITGEGASSARMVSPGQLTESGGKPSSWDPDSSSYKAWKKNYNARYYRENRDYWRKYYGVKNPIAPSSATSNSYRDDAYRQAAEARARANSNSVNYDRRSNAQKMLDRSAADASPSRPTFGGELFNAKSRLNDMWAAGAGAIANAGKSFLKNWTSGASALSGGAKNARSSFNDMWANGASAITSAGKSFLDAWKAGIGK